MSCIVIILLICRDLPGFLSGLFQLKTTPPFPEVTLPISTGCSPFSCRVWLICATLLSGQIMSIPIPILNTRYISSSLIVALRRITSKIGGMFQLPHLISALQSAGRIRGVFSVIPPPVICTRPCIGALVASSNAFITGLTYIRVGSSRVSPRFFFQICDIGGD